MSVHVGEVSTRVVPGADTGQQPARPTEPPLYADQDLWTRERRRNRRREARTEAQGFDD